MIPERTLPKRRTEIDRRIADRIDAVAGETLAAELATVPERDDRWYGQLLVLSHDAVTEAADTAEAADAATPTDAATAVNDAATAIELLREYWALRERLLVRLDEGALDRSDRELTTRLLASDFLFTSSYATLGDLRGERTAPCVEAFESAAESVVEAFGDEPSRSALPREAFCAFADATAGALGRGAAVVGATLAGADDADIERLAAVGSGFAAARRVRAATGESVDEPRVAPTSPNEQRLRRFATRRLDEAERALDALAETATTDALEAFVDADRALGR